MIRSLAYAIAVTALFLLFGQGCTKGPMLGITPDGASFVGSSACKDCHAEAFASWQESWHSKIVRPAKGAFLEEAVAKWATDGTNAGPTLGNVTGTPFKREDVQLVVGSRWKQLYLVKNEAIGNLQFMNMQFNRASGKWEAYEQKNDWNTQCAACHTTGYRILKYGEKSRKTLVSEFAELNVGCEACHGPGSIHVASSSRQDIFNPANVIAAEQSRLCGYCHVRLENQMWRSAQGNPREDLPAPAVFQSYRAGDDWTAWYPQDVVIPGVQPGNPFDKEYAGDLNGLFILDDQARAGGIYEEARNRQEYQGFIQSAHYKSGVISCTTCHSPHADKEKAQKVAKNTCGSCHDAAYTVEKYMSGTGRIAENLFIRSHTFNKTPRPGGPVSEGMPKYFSEPDAGTAAPAEMKSVPPSDVKAAPEPMAKAPTEPEAKTPPPAQ